MESLYEVIFAALGVIITGLAGVITTKLTQWINDKIADQKAAKYLSLITKLVTDAVQETYQTYVETLKEEGSFGQEAQEKALAMCLANIKSHLAPQLIEYITENFGELTDYLISLIESTIYSLKAKNKH